VLPGEMKGEPMKKHRKLTMPPALRSWIQKGRGMGAQGGGTKVCAIVSVPKASWDLIQETLALDMSSKGFDPKLRQEIRRAVESIKSVRYGPCR